ncbi:DNA polymerase III catalytic subunit PolC type [Vagococcus fluvialis]|uniref:DNA polymerase III PolC-type n=1 Tax=Vagococcus fluvialis TaxID=2738 RepID=A0A369B5M0_9ENTE|nr:PolC-type DNA polymerase III [Vagococcus fluvialis]OTP29253.1 DNA polymerase III, alpha subunit, Gram-positive type [Enterococcus sp. 6C8_DIV0013]MBO0419675.1 PolC-type DNA polymerase III [Vagococcus fluvialis]MBO0444442.1 PolC-type DNA polymerase III [Vagococcus fluvialis]RCX15918.1 DNA polymerase III catalytic subunit PolC type [Vagococcus fluvialis]RSU04205.1 PolC-type DNA polymerase III [Vagococcus fluvialis]
MAMNSKELFSQLLNQIGLEKTAENTQILESGEIKEVTVHKKSKLWEFHILFSDILPFTLYKEFYNCLTVAFQSIANIKLTIQSNNPKFDNQILQDYWLEVLKDESCGTPVVKQRLSNQMPFIDDQQVVLLVENEGMIDYISQQYAPIIVDSYQKFGFPKFKFQPRMDEQKAAEIKKAFDERQREQTEQMMKQAAQAIEKNEQQQKQKAEVAPLSGPIQLGRSIPADEVITSMGHITEEERRVTIEGYVFSKEVRDLRSGRKILIIKMTDYTSSFSVKKFSNNDKDVAVFEAIKEGSWLKVRGSIQEDTFMRDLVMNCQDLIEVKHAERKDTAPEDQKRVELHAHTNMSTMDAVSSATALVTQAAKWGMPAIAITDHAGAQAFPDAYHAGQKNGVKVLFGLEANVVDDGVPIAYQPKHVLLTDATYIVFDVETTGLSAVYDTIIELAAVRMHKGNVIDTFEQFIDPGHPLSQTTINLTGITDEMVRGSKSEKEVLTMFREFCGEDILVAHNASFDMGFLNTSYEKYDMPEAPNPVIDTLELSRLLHPEMKSHRLNTLSKKYNINLEQHHRAVYDSEATGHLCWIFVKKAKEDFGVEYHDEFNQHIGEGDAYKRARPFHVTILAKTQDGLKNLFKLISMSNVNYYYRVPRIPRSKLNELREGLLIGSACSSGEIFEAMMQKGVDEAKKRAKFYDYIEIMPKPVYAPLISAELVKNNEDMEDIIQNLVQIGEDLNKPVVATGNVHYINEEESIYRKILINSMGGANPLNRHPLPDVKFRTTNEMLEEFAFLGKEVAQKVVVDNTHLIAEMCEEVVPVKKDLYTPKIEGSEDEITNLSYSEAHRLYGEELPEIVVKRIEKELKSINGNGFSVIYLISQKLVHKSLQDGYLVGSRGSVGSSFVATMTGITEVNPLPPHYRCPECKYSEFFEDGSYGSGFDLPEKECPTCGARLFKDGHDIPFETFLGFHGDKVPDIDLNFSGVYQSTAHNYTKVLFGEDYVYKAGTIGTVADKTAYGFVKGYERDNNYNFRAAEIDRLAKGSTGVKRTTGQHPGGIIVIPDYMDVYDFTPIQYPADDQTAEWRTTHFDFHSIHDNVLKLDILGHDDPTVIRMLQDLSGIDPKTIPTDDPEVMKIFAGPQVLGVEPDQIFSKTGTLGIPEFGTKFVRGMLEQTHPTTFSELLQISGLSHGTDVWLGNADELIKRGEATLAKVIGCRDDIMVYLMHAGLEDGIAFKIMESVRKGKGIPDDWQKEMRDNNVPEWYIDSCLKIKYMFPKAHAAAYVLMALRVAYFKVHFPIIYYAAYFSVRADDFDIAAMSQGKEATKAAMKEIMDKGMDASTKEKNLLTVLELANEMLERGFKFGMIDLYKSDAENFIIDGDTLIAPFRSVPSLGANVAKQIVIARNESKFLSKEDLANRGKVSKTIIEYMTENGVLKDLPDENQLSLFDML